MGGGGGEGEGYKINVDILCSGDNFVETSGTTRIYGTLNTVPVSTSLKDMLDN